MINLVHLVPHATDIGHPRKLAAFVLSVMTLSSLFGRFIFGYLADKINPGKLMCVLLIVMALAMVVFLNILGIKNLTYFYAYVIIFGCPWGAIAGLTAAIIGKNFGAASFGAIFGGVFFLRHFRDRIRSSLCRLDLRCHEEL